MHCLSSQPTATPGGRTDTCHISVQIIDFPLVCVAELLEQHGWKRWLNKVEISASVKLWQIINYTLEYSLSSHYLRQNDHPALQLLFRDLELTFSSLFSILVHLHGSHRIFFFFLPQLKRLWNSSKRQAATVSSSLVNIAGHLTAKGPNISLKKWVEINTELKGE